jgi:hypothetical protein
VYITLMRAFLQLKQPVLDLLCPFLPRFLICPLSAFAMGASGGDSLVVSLGVRETRLELEVLKVSGDESAWVFPKKPSILVGCGVE